MGMQQSTVETFIKTALTARIDAAKTPGSNLKWTTAKMPWIRFTSNVTGVDDTTYRTLESPDYISGPKVIYDTSKLGRNLPKPGIISATIKHTGTLKTLKNVDVKCKCWSIGQLVQLEQLFMSLGKTVVLEYGWSRMPDGKAVTHKMSADSKNLRFGAFVKKSKALAKLNQGCYDAVKGVVSNFKWSQDADGGFTCTSTLTSPAEMMMSTSSSDVTSAVCCRFDANASAEQVEAVIKALTAAGMSRDAAVKHMKSKHAKSEEECKAGTTISRKLTEILQSEVIPVGGTLTRGGKLAGFAIRIDKEQSEAEKADRSFFDSIKGMFTFGTSMMTTMKYITWGYFENAIVNGGLFPVTSGVSGASDYTTTGTQGPAAFDVKGNKYAFRMDTTRTLVDNPEYMTSADPTICMLPGQPFWALKGGTLKSLLGWGNDFKHMGGYLQMENFKSRTDDKLGWLSSVCINVRFLMICALESETAGEFVNKVLDGINGACGNKWDLVLTPLEDNPSVMTIVDTVCLGPEVTPYALNVFGNYSIAKEVTINTEVSDAVKAQVMYGANSAGDDENDFSLFGEGLGDSTTGWGELKQNDTDQCINPEAAVTPATGSELEKILENYEDAWESLVDSTDSTTIQTMKDTVKALQEFTDVPADVEPSHPPILPINFSFTMDGINGFKWGNSLKVNDLPPRYSGASFMVTAIDHSISADTWDTTIETVMRAR